MTACRALPFTARHWLVWAAAVLLSACGAAGFAADAPAAAPQGFKHRGFYLHEGWLFKHPFAVRSWKREDFAAMYRLLKRLGFDRVMNWPMFESIPAPLSETNAEALRDYRRTIDDAHAAGLEFWLAQTANLTPPPSIAAKPWKERNPYPVWKHVRLNDPAEAAAYFAWRTRPGSSPARRFFSTRRSNTSPRSRDRTCSSPTSAGCCATRRNMRPPPTASSAMPSSR